VPEVKDRAQMGGGGARYDAVDLCIAAISAHEAGGGGLALWHGVKGDVRLH